MCVCGNIGYICHLKQKHRYIVHEVIFEGITSLIAAHARPTKECALAEIMS